MATYSNLAVKLLRDAARFFRDMGKENIPVKTQMNDNAEVYEQLADLLENDPLAEIDMG